MRLAERHLVTSFAVEKVGDRVAAVPPVQQAFVRRLRPHAIWLWWRRGRSPEDVVLVAVTRSPPPS